MQTHCVVESSVKYELRSLIQGRQPVSSESLAVLIKPDESLFLFHSVLFLRRAHTSFHLAVLWPLLIKPFNKTIHGTWRYRRGHVKRTSQPERCCVATGATL